jgi:hypothetical protein
MRRGRVAGAALDKPAEQRYNTEARGSHPHHPAYVTLSLPWKSTATGALICSSSCARNTRVSTSLRGERPPAPHSGQVHLSNCLVPSTAINTLTTPTPAATPMQSSVA